jgi:uncharacterized membrane protein
MTEQIAFFSDDTVVFGLLSAVLGIVFYLSNKVTGVWPKIFRVVPALLWCYLIPALLNSVNLISSENSDLYTIAKNYLLPASLVLLTLSIDIRAILGLGPKALIMFIAGTIGVVIGGPTALALFGAIEPALLADAGNESTWRGLATLAGSWIGGGANQTAMFVLYEYEESLYSGMVAVDVIVYNFWMAALIWGVGRSNAIDKWLKADNSAIERLKNKVVGMSAGKEEPFTFSRSMQILGVGFGATGLAHFLAGPIAERMSQIPIINEQFSFLAGNFFWLIVIATTVGLLLSFTKFRKLEYAGASRWGTIFLYYLIATIGMKIDLLSTFSNLYLIGIGFVWIIIHGVIMLVVAKIIKAPYFYIAVGSTANVGGAASAPVVAGAFHSSLATVGVLLAVLGYAVGTYGAIACAKLMELISY